MEEDVIGKKEDHIYLKWREEAELSRQGANHRCHSSMDLCFAELLSNNKKNAAYNLCSSPFSPANSLAGEEMLLNVHLNTNSRHTGFVYTHTTVQ
jgi:hypothetical protein